MANRLTITRVRLQDVTPAGKPVRKPRYAVEATDNHEHCIIGSRSSMRELNWAIRQSGGDLLAYVQMFGSGAFAGLSGVVTGFENFEGEVPEPA